MIGNVRQVSRWIWEQEESVRTPGGWVEYDRRQRAETGIMTEVIET